MQNPFYPPALRALASKQPVVRVKLTADWDSVAMQSRSYSSGEVERRFASKAADKLAHDLAGHFLARKQFRFIEDLEGIHVKADIHAFSHDELLELLYQTFREGQTYAMQYGPKIVPSEEVFLKACQEMGKELATK